MESAYSNVPLTVAVRPMSGGGGGGRRDHQSAFFFNTSGSNNSSSSASSSTSSSSLSASESDSRRERRLLASLRHVNVARLVGVVTEGGGGAGGSAAAARPPPPTAMEHSPHGDLYHFLRQRSLSTSSSLSSTSPDGGPTDLPGDSVTVDLSRLLDLSAQVARGMAYLESRCVVHRDLAARNCLVFDGWVVKVTDVAMGMSLFNADYSEAFIGRRAGVGAGGSGSGALPAPLRWQPWETIVSGRVTPRSNSFSFGVAAWEILSLCRRRPMADLTDVEVARAAEDAANRRGAQVTLVGPN